MQYVPYSGRLRNDTLQLGEDRALAISLIVDLIATLNSTKQARAS
jgi:hypothetical protein